MLLSKIKQVIFGRPIYAEEPATPKEVAERIKLFIEQIARYPITQEEGNKIEEVVNSIIDSTLKTTLERKKNYYIDRKN